MKADNFGFKNAWLAVRHSEPAVVASALHLRDIRAACWEDGIRAAYEWPDATYGTAVFVTPPFDGWVLCAGSALFEFADRRPPEFAGLAQRLAKQLNCEVQYFCTHRVVEAHAWARATPEGLERAYLYVGESAETIVNHGSPTAQETSLHFSFFDETRPEAQRDDYWEREDLTYPHEDDVMRLASLWSIDPSSLADRNLEVPDGFIGHLGEPKPIATTPEPARPAKAWRFW